MTQYLLLLVVLLHCCAPCAPGWPAQRSCVVLQAQTAVRRKFSSCALPAQMTCGCMLPRGSAQGADCHSTRLCLRDAIDPGPHLFFTEVQAIRQCSCHWLSYQPHYLQASKLACTKQIRTRNSAKFQDHHERALPRLFLHRCAYLHTC
jgi:hypothetical protein